MPVRSAPYEAQSSAVSLARRHPAPRRARPPPWVDGLRARGYHIVPCCFVPDPFRAASTYLTPQRCAEVPGTEVARRLSLQGVRAARVESPRRAALAQNGRQGAAEHAHGPHLADA